PPSSPSPPHPAAARTTARATGRTTLPGARPRGRPFGVRLGVRVIHATMPTAGTPVNPHGPRAERGPGVQPPPRAPGCRSGRTPGPQTGADHSDALARSRYAIAVRARRARFELASRGSPSAPDDPAISGGMLSLERE